MCVRPRRFHEVAHLSLRHNAFTEHGLGGLGAFSGLVTLNLAHNRIASLHGLLEHCPRALRRLNLAHNAISYIPSQMPLASLQVTVGIKCAVCVLWPGPWARSCCDKHREPGIYDFLLCYVE